LMGVVEFRRIYTGCQSAGKPISDRDFGCGAKA
jgi:hypothetical protein